VLLVAQLKPAQTKNVEPSMMVVEILFLVDLVLLVTYVKTMLVLPTLYANLVLMLELIVERLRSLDVQLNPVGRVPMVINVHQVNVKLSLALLVLKTLLVLLDLVNVWMVLKIYKMVMVVHQLE